MDMTNCYLVEVGVLLEESDPEFESYNHVYDKKHGYYDEGQYYLRDLERAKKEAKEYVKDGVENTYAIITKTFLPDDVNPEEADVEDETYIVEDIVFSAVKRNNQIIENFVEKT